MLPCNSRPFILYLLPDIALDRICWYLDSTSFCRLWKSGSPPLLAKLQLVTSFSVQFNGLGGYIWPKIVDSLKNLRFLSISSTSPVIGFRVQKLPPNMKGISFKWQKCEESLVILDGTSIHKKALPLAQILPQLEFISLNGSYQLKTDFIKALPLTLRDLRLNNAGGLVPSDFSLLPSDLELLEIDHVSNAFYRAVITFPPNLKVFTAKSGLWTDEQMAMLPNGITVLNLFESSFSDNAVGLLPRTLLELRVPMCHWSDEAMEALPTQLLLLDLSLNEQLTSACFSHLPRSLLWLNLESITWVHTQHLVHLPKGLKFYNFGRAFVPSTPPSGLLSKVSDLVSGIFGSYKGN